MTRRGAFRRSLILLLALLMVTPQVLLRPCCCAREKSTELKMEAQATAIPAGLPPCCLKRLQAAQRSESDAKHLDSQLPGVHDSSKCACRSHSQLARSNRAVFKPMDQRQVMTWIAIPAANQLSQPALNLELLAAAQTAPPDWGVERAIRFCCWQV